MEAGAKDPTDDKHIGVGRFRILGGGGGKPIPSRHMTSY